MPLESDALERRHTLFAWAICLEASVGFVGPGLLLVLLTSLMPFRLLTGDLKASGVFVFVLIVVLGWCGLAAVVRIVFFLCAGRRHDQRAGWTLLGLACGVGLTLYTWYAVWAYNGHLHPTTLACVYLPLACAAHLLYLARAVFARPTIPS